jgi:hypothetical protein
VVGEVEEAFERFLCAVKMQKVAIIYISSISVIVAV